MAPGHGEKAIGMATRVVKFATAFPPFQAAASSWCASRPPAAAAAAAAADFEADQSRPYLWSKHTIFGSRRTRWWDDNAFFRHHKRKFRPPAFQQHQHQVSASALWCTNSNNNNNKTCSNPAWEHAAAMQLDPTTAPTAFPPPRGQHQGIGIGPRLQQEHGGGLTPQSVKNLCQQGHAKAAVQALQVLVATMNKGIHKSVFYSVVRECAVHQDVTLGAQVHALAVQTGLGSDTFLCNHFIRMYAAHGMLQEAVAVFAGVALPDAITWSSIISAHVKQGQARRAVQLYKQMRATTTGMMQVQPNGYVLVAALQACAVARDLQAGKQVHQDVLTAGMQHNMFVCNALVDMYAKCGSLRDARGVFDALDDKDVVTWTAMIAGYARQEGTGQEALNIYRAMVRGHGVPAPNAVTYVCLLEACASVGALQQGRHLHCEIRRRGLQANVLVGSCLIRMYARCGCLEVSRQVFDALPVKNVVTWNALLKGYAEHGEGGMAIQCFQELLAQGVRPNEVTYTCLFSACSHAGLVHQGQHFFKTMVERHGVEPDDWHYNCMVDLLGRSGHLDKAEQVLRASPGGDSAAVGWKALLSACKSYGDADTGRRCFDRLVELEPGDATSYVLLGSIYANAERWDEVGRVEGMRKAAGARKTPARACIEVSQEVHEFTVGEEGRCDVAAGLRHLGARVKQGGHVPHTQLVLRANACGQDKEDALCGHAEKLALAYGLLNTPAGAALLVTKNLRMCGDCHSSTKVLSRLERRQIVVRDAHKVHRFQNGACSCRDRP